MSFLDLEHKKGDPAALDGRLTVYARVDMDPSEAVETSHPAASMLHNGLLVAQGNYREQYSLRDFLRSEMGVSLEEGLEELLSRVDGLESALDPDKLKEKLEEMEGMEEFIPTPAKIVAFHSEHEILAQDGDVFFAGTFRSVGNAVLSVNSFPILYQARYREQMLLNVRAEIDRLVGQVERNEVPAKEVEKVGRFTDGGVNVAQRLEGEFIPRMLYSRGDSSSFRTAEGQLRAFLQGYRFPDDIDAIVAIIQSNNELTRQHSRQLELYARKIDAVAREDFGEAESMQRELRELDERDGEQGPSQ